VHLLNFTTVQLTGSAEFWLRQIVRHTNRRVSRQLGGRLSVLKNQAPRVELIRLPLISIDTTHT